MLVNSRPSRIVSHRPFLRPSRSPWISAVVRPGDGGARAQQDQRVEQRQVERIHHRLDRLGRELPADDFGQLAGEQREVEPRPEPADEEHHFRGDEQDHAVAQVQLHDRGVIAGMRFLHDVREPAEERGEQAGDAERRGRSLPPGMSCMNSTMPLVKVTRRDRADQRPDVGRQDVVIVVLGSGHGSLSLIACLRRPLMRPVRLGPEGGSRLSPVISAVGGRCS